MAHLYPSLDEKFKYEGVCPICLITMVNAPKYKCENGHEVCYRCKPYYYACPTCQSPWITEILPTEERPYHMPPSIHHMPQPYSPYPPSAPTAPFLNSERDHWNLPLADKDQELFSCQYSLLGCFAKFPQHLREVHETRCQFRPYLEEEHLPTDLPIDESTAENCKYYVVGCNVKLATWRKLAHEQICIYKDKASEVDELQQTFDSISFDNEDPNELVDCKYRNDGCMVRMPRRRKIIHEQKCNHSKYHRDGDEIEEVVYYFPESHIDSNEPVPCRWAEYGCQVQTRHCRKELHEEKCNYRRVPCRYAEYGCHKLLELSNKHLHEASCSYS